MSSIHVKETYRSIYSQPPSSLWSTPRSGRLLLLKGADIHCTGGWVGPRAGVNGCKENISYPYRHSNPRPSSPQRVVIPTAISRPSSVSQSAAILPKTKQRCIFVIWWRWLMIHSAWLHILYSMAYWVTTTRGQLDGQQPFGGGEKHCTHFQGACGQRNQRTKQLTKGANLDIPRSLYSCLSNNKKHIAGLWHWNIMRLR